MSDSKGNFVLAHLADLHLGYRAGGRLNAQGINWREVDGYVGFHRMVTDIINDGEVDAVLIAGDVFHSPAPATRAVSIAQKELRRLAYAHLPVYILTGNHDTSDIRADLAATALLNDPDKGIHSHCEPYKFYEIADGITLHLVSHHLYKEQSSTWDKLRPQPGEVNIFSTHGSVIDPITKLQLHTAQSPREVVIPDEILDNPGWTYRLLGHIHERGFVGSRDGVNDTAGLRTYYNGSLLRRGFSDLETPLGRGWTKWHVLPDGDMQPDFRLLWQRPQVDFPVIEAGGMTAAEVTEAVIGNLDSAFPEDGTNWAAAPILRQKVVGLSRDKRKAVDTARIGEHARRALTWSLGLRTVEDESPAERAERGAGVSGTLGERYADWLHGSKAWDDMHETIREKVAAESSRLLTQGLDSVLDSE